MALNSWKNKTDEHNKLKLKEGMIVELRNNDRHLLREVEGGFILSGHSSWLIYTYNDALTDLDCEFDIMKVYESNAYMDDLFNDDYLTCIWERKEQKKERKKPKETTVAEISKTSEKPQSEEEDYDR